MRPKWKRTLSVVLASATLLLTAPALPIRADGADVAPEAGQSSLYRLTDTVLAEVKSVLNEREGDGTRIGAVVRLVNDGTRVTRVPDYELRARTADGIEYTLRPSAANAKAIQPKERVELSYMLTLEHVREPELSELIWVDVNEYVYPKEETVVLSVPVDAIVWRGDDDAVADAEWRPWGQPFTLPVLSETIVFTPVTLTREKTPNGPVEVVTLIAENKGERTETVPNFRLDGLAGNRTYAGQRVEAEVELKPGEKKYVHYGILTENNAELAGLVVKTPETFVQVGPDGNPNVVTYAVGRFWLDLPQQTGTPLSRLPEYKLREPIAFDPMNKLIDEHTTVSLVDLSLNESDTAGYNTIVAKFLVKNNDTRPAPLPAFQVELSNEAGFRYFGTRQTTAVQQLMPNLSYVINYFFTVPSTEKGDTLVMNILDGVTAAPYNVPIAGMKVAVRQDENSDVLSFYPYQVKLNYWAISAQGSAAGYTYKLKIDVDITAVDDVVADPNASNMKIELADPLGRTIASQTLPFTGPNRLVSGAQHIYFQNLRTDQFEWPLTIRLYEAIQTPAGEAKRLVATFKQ